MALLKWPHPYHAAHYLSALAMEEPDPDESFGDGEDPEIIEGEYTSLIERATDEISWRRDVLGSFYPFLLTRRGSTWEIAFNRNGSPRDRLAQDAYVACLLMSAARHGRLNSKRVGLIDVKTIAECFQAIVYLVAPALVGGDSFWIAFPRPEGDDYDPALRRLVQEMETGRVKHEGPPSQRSNKDGGVDVVLWRRSPDRRSNLIVSYGQVATGKRWRDKSVKNKLDSHFHRWMEDRPTIHYLPSMFVPHVMHENLREGGEEFEILARDDAMTLESLLGTVVDRIRLAHLVGQSGGIIQHADTARLAHYRSARRWISLVSRDLRSS